MVFAAPEACVRQQRPHGGWRRGTHARLQRLRFCHHCRSERCLVRKRCCKQCSDAQPTVLLLDCAIAHPSNAADCAGADAPGNIYCLGKYVDGGSNDANSAASYVSISVICIYLQCCFLPAHSGLHMDANRWAGSGPTLLPTTRSILAAPRANLCLWRLQYCTCLQLLCKYWTAVRCKLPFKPSIYVHAQKYSGSENMFADASASSSRRCFGDLPQGYLPKAVC